MRVYVKGIPFLNHIFHPSLALSGNIFLEIEARQVHCQYTPVSVFWVSGGPFISPAKILVSWEFQEEYVQGLNVKELSNHVLTYVRFLCFLCVGATD